MSRAFKFRVWDLIAKQYWHNIDGMVNHGIIVNANGDPGIVCDLGMVGSPEKSISIFKKDRLVIEQFTGLFDANGCDIYEGDILRYDYPERGDNLVEVRWSLETEDNHPGFRVIDTYDQGGNCQVIGNVHENPELL